MTVMLYQGDCLEVMATLPADSVDSIITDPPYGLSFMGKDWDHGVPGAAFWREALRAKDERLALLQAMIAAQERVIAQYQDVVARQAARIRQFDELLDDHEVRLRRVEMKALHVTFSDN